MCAIEEMVVDAMSESGLARVPHYVTPFPGQYHSERFKKEMKEIIRKLPSS
jgi:hypothetical protein